MIIFMIGLSADYLLNESVIVLSIQCQKLVKAKMISPNLLFCHTSRQRSQRHLIYYQIREIKEANPHNREARTYSTGNFLFLFF